MIEEFEQRDIWDRNLNSVRSMWQEFKQREIYEREIQKREIYATGI